MRASSARARRLLEACEGARTPALSGLSPDPLTPREREVAMLAARGLTSAEIERAARALSADSGEPSAASVRQAGGCQPFRAATAPPAGTRIHFAHPSAACVNPQNLPGELSTDVLNPSRAGPFTVVA